MKVTLRHSRIHAVDCAECETKEGMLDRIEQDIALTGALDPAQPIVNNTKTDLTYRCIVLAIDIQDAARRSLRTALVNVNDYLRSLDLLYFLSALPTPANDNLRVQSYEVLHGGGM